MSLYLNCWTCKWNWLRFQLITFFTRKRKKILSKSPHWKLFIFEHEYLRKEKQMLDSCSENALEKRRWLSYRAANETFATSVRRTLRSSRSRQFLQAGSTTIQGIVLDVARLPGERRPTCLPVSSLLVDALSRHYWFSTGACAHEGTVTD